MKAKLRVGALGLTHDHIWSNLADLRASDLGELVAVADPNPPLLDRVRSEYGVAAYDSYEAMLEQTELDAVYVYADNAESVELVEMAADRGLHCLVEKPLAADLLGADRMLAAVRRAGVQLMVNWPFAWWPGFQHALTMAESGQIGRLFQTRYRAAHGGPKELGCSPYFYDWLYDPARNGAGALADYCSYGAALARHLLGQPSRVTGTVGRLVKEYVLVDDNAVIVMQWPRAIAIAEASWSQIGHLTSYVTAIYGTEGTLLIEPGRDGKVLLADRDHDRGREVEVPPLPQDAVNATAYFLSHIAREEPITGLCSAEVGRDAQEILEAGLLSSASGTAVSLPLPMAYA
ncbi:MAG: Gfo/Idh/MocA family protein [Anaerolineae bacterium]|jgi:predicted dehydrogenase